MSSAVSAYAGPATPAGIRALIAKADLRRGSTGPQSAANFLRIGGVDFDAATKPVGQSGTPIMDVWGINPATGLPWSTSDLTGIEVGLKSEA